MKNTTVLPRLLTTALFAVICFGGNIASADEQKPVSSEGAVSSASALVSSNLVARVNGVPISSLELRRAKKVLLRGQAVPPEQQAAVDRQAVEQLVSAELLYQASAKQEIKDMEGQIDAKMAQGKLRFKNPEDFSATLKQIEMTETDLREYTRRDLLISRFIETTFVPKVTVSDAEVKAFYDANRDKFTQGESVKASHILIGIDANATSEDKTKAREKAEKLKKDLVAGADFAQLAKDNSTCPSSKQGGDLGSFGKGQMVPPFEKAAFALKPGETSDVVETQFGYHIIKLTDKKGAETTALSDVKGKIENQLKIQKVNEAVQQFVSETRKTAQVEVLLK